MVSGVFSKIQYFNNNVLQVILKPKGKVKNVILILSVLLWYYDYHGFALIMI